MHLNAHRHPADHLYEADICIIGAGAAGSVMAHELGKAGRKVLLVEAGSLKGHGGTQALYQGETSDPDFHLPPDRDRTRGLGGTSAIWGGRCMPFDPLDFAQRPHIAYSGWPIGAETMAPFFRRAQIYAECGAYEYDVQKVGLDGALIEGFEDGDIITNSLERWSPPVNFGQKLKSQIVASHHVTVLTGAVCVALTRAGKTITQATLRTVRGGKQQKVTANRFILAGGGLEVTRLLLGSGGTNGTAIGDASGWLGRGYMCHVGGVISRIRFHDGQKILFGYEADPDGVYVRRRFTLSPEVQRRRKLLNTYLLLDRPLLSDPSHGSAVLSLLYLAKGLLQRHSETGSGGGKFAHYRRHLKNLIFGAPEVLTVLPKFGRQRFLKGRRVPSLLASSKDNVFYLYFHSEQSPARDSKIVLAQGKDRLGQRQLRVEARLSQTDVQAIKETHLVIADSLAAQNVGTLEFLQDDVEAAIRACKCTLGHHIGTTRMAATAENGVVDADCRVYGIKNMYIASSSVFPTSSQAHPTLTLLALTLRLCEHILRANTSGQVQSEPAMRYNESGQER